MINELEKRVIAARKAQDKPVIKILSTLIGNLKSNAKMVDGEKVVTDDAVLSAVRYNLKGLAEMLKHKPDDPEIVFEKDVLEGLLPQQMTEDELSQAISDIIHELAEETKSANLGMVMKVLKERHNGLYDGRTASTFAKAAIEAW